MQQESRILLRGAPRKIHILLLSKNWVITLAVSLSSICLTSQVRFSYRHGVFGGTLVCANWCRQTVTEVTASICARDETAAGCARLAAGVVIFIYVYCTRRNGLSPPENTVGVDTGRQGHSALSLPLPCRRREKLWAAHLISPCRISDERCLLLLQSETPGAFQIMKNVAWRTMPALRRRHWHISSTANESSRTGVGFVRENSLIWRTKVDSRESRRTMNIQMFESKWKP